MSASKSYTKAAVMLAAIVGIVLFMSIKPDPKSFEAFFSGLGQTSTMNINRHDMPPAYEEAQKDSIKKTFAGFWTYDGEFSDHVQLFDRIEFKDNGIIWRFTKWTVELPSGDTATVAQMTQAYASPYAPLAGDPLTINCEAQVIKQVNMHAADTVYGTVFPPELWTIALRDSAFELGGRPYTSYGDSSLADFFPSGMVNLVADGRVVRSPVDFPVLEWLRAELVEDAKKLLPSSDPARIRQVVAEWYVPLCLRMAYAAPTGGTIPADTAQLSFDLMVNPDGSIKDVSVKTGGTFGLTLRKSLRIEVGKWRFPPTQLEKALRVRYDSHATGP